MAASELTCPQSVFTQCCAGVGGIHTQLGAASHSGNFKEVKMLEMNIETLLQAAEYIERRERGTLVLNL